MKILIWSILLTAGLVLPVSGDEFEDFIQTCAKVSSNYNRAIRSPNTRFDKEYREYLRLLKNQSAGVQAAVRKMKLGQDFDFPALASELERIYLGAGYKTENKGKAKLVAHSSSPESILKILTEDVKALRKMEFAMVDGGSIKTSLETRRRLCEFRRLIDFFRKNYRSVRKGPEKKDFSLLRIFHERMMRMSALSGDLMQVTRKRYPDALSQYNLQSETAQLMKYFDAWCKLPYTASGSPKNKKSVHHQKRLDGLNTAAALRTEIDVSIRNINDLLAQWENAGFQTDDPLSRRLEKESSDPAAPLLRKTEEKDYAAMNSQQLSRLLQERRQAILRSNSSMDGFDRDAERMFLLSLSRGQKRLYNEYLRYFEQQGYSAEQSIRSAVLKIHTKIQTDSKPPADKEMIRLLQALDKEEMRRREKNDLQFKMKRSRIDRD